MGGGERSLQKKCWGKKGARIWGGTSHKKENCLGAAMCEPKKITRDWNGDPRGKSRARGRGQRGRELKKGGTPSKGAWGE